MLVLTRRIGEQVVVPQCRLTVTILDATSGRVRLGISAPANVVVHRGEVCERIRAEETLDMGGVMMSVRILIADRDEFLLAAYREHLSRRGVIVNAAMSSQAALPRSTLLALEP